MRLIRNLLLAGTVFPALVAGTALATEPAGIKTPENTTTHTQQAGLPSHVQVKHWHTRAASELDLAANLIEFGCTNRSEIILANLIRWGVPLQALGRISSFYDLQQHGEAAGNTFTLADPAHDSSFQEAWVTHYGKDVPRRIEIGNGDNALPLDVSGTIRWNIGHIAPTITATGENGETRLYVIDPVLNPHAPLTVEDWQKAQNGQSAALVWGGLGEAPQVLPAYLSAHQRQELAVLMGSKTADPTALTSHLNNLPPQQKQQVQAQLLGIKADAPWHPRHWRGYSFVGELTDADGQPFPDWHAASETEFTARLERAEYFMAPLREYQQRRSAHKNLARFLSHETTRQTAGETAVKLAKP